MPKITLPTETVIKTPLSALTIRHSTELSALLPQCVDDVKGKLIVRPDFFLQGKMVPQCRNIGFFSDEVKGFRTAGQLFPSHSLTPSLKELLDGVNQMYGTDFNGIHVNHYKDGNDFIGPHSDDAREVVFASFGAIRHLRVCNKKSKELVREVLMMPTRFLHMSGDFQREFTHEIPIDERITTARFSFTFRHVVE